MKRIFSSRFDLLGKSRFYVLVLVLFIIGCSDMPDVKKINISAAQNEVTFNNIVSQAIYDSQSTDNDVKRNKIKSIRTKSLCNLFKNRHIKDWYGVVTKVDSTIDGQGVLWVQLVSNVEVIYENGLLKNVRVSTEPVLLETGAEHIKSKTKNYDVLAELEKSDLIKFSGSFLPSNSECIYESSFTLKGGLEEPEFIFKFTKIEKFQLDKELNKYKSSTKKEDIAKG